MPITQTPRPQFGWQIVIEQCTLTSIAFHLLSTTHTATELPMKHFCLVVVVAVFFVVSFGMFRISNDHCDTVISRVAHAVLFCLN